MIWTPLVTLLSVLQLFVFALMVASARAKYKLPVPAVMGQPIVERYIRVQQNTLEIIFILLPSLWIATLYWREWIGASFVVVYLVGRILYMRGYIEAPEKRHVGFQLSMIPILGLIFLDLVGMVRSLI